jgi:hypothetical protein
MKINPGFITFLVLVSFFMSAVGFYWAWEKRQEDKQKTGG